MIKTNLVEEIHFSGFGLFVRLAITSVIGVVIAGSLTLFMHVLIEFSQQELVETGQANFLDFVRVKREETSQRKKAKPQRPKNQEAPPAPPTPQASEQSVADAGLAVSIPTASADLSIDMGISIGKGDGEYLPIVKVAPAYPMEAVANNIEGSCVVEFTVTPAGTTTDVIAVREFCPQIFVRASVAAAKKFKYKPRIVDGVAIAVPNVQNRFLFILDNKEGQ